MAAKLTFESKIDGIDKILDYLDKASKKISDMPQAGDKAFESMNKKAQDFEAIMKQLNSSQSGVSGIVKSFNQINSKASDIIGESQKTITEVFKRDIQSFKDNVKTIMQEIDDADAKLAELRKNRANYSNEEFTAKEAALLRGKHKAQHGLVLGAGQLSEAEQALKDNSYVYNNKYFGSLTQGQVKAGIANMLPFGMGQALMAGNPFLWGAAGIAATSAIANAADQHLNYSPDRQYMSQRDYQKQAAEAAVNGDPSLMYARQMGINKGKELNDSVLHRQVRGMRYWMGGHFMSKSYDEFRYEDMADADRTTQDMFADAYKGSKITRDLNRRTALQERAYGMQGSANINLRMLGQSHSIDETSELTEMIMKYGGIGSTSNNSRTGDLAVLAKRLGIQDTKKINDMLAYLMAKGGNSAGLEGKMLDLAGTAGLFKGDSLAARNTVYSASADMVKGLDSSLISGNAGAGIAAATNVFAGANANAGDQASAANAAVGINSIMTKGGGAVENASYQAIYTLIGRDPTAAKFMLEAYNKDKASGAKMIAGRATQVLQRRVTPEEVIKVLDGAKSNVIKAETQFAKNSGGMQYLQSKEGGGYNTEALTLGMGWDTAKSIGSDFDKGVQALSTSQLNAGSGLNVEISKTGDDVINDKQAEIQKRAIQNYQKALKTQGTDPSTFASTAVAEAVTGMESVFKTWDASTKKLIEKIEESQRGEDGKFDIGNKGNKTAYDPIENAIDSVFKGSQPPSVIPNATKVGPWK